MTKIWIPIMLFGILATSGFAAVDAEMAACLPDNLGVFKATRQAATDSPQDKVIAVSRSYKNGAKTATVTVWKIPGNSDIWPHIGGQKKATLVVVSGRLCILNIDEAKNAVTLVVRFEKGFVNPPPAKYTVTIEMQQTTDAAEAQQIAEQLDHDRLFRLYDLRE